MAVARGEPPPFVRKKLDLAERTFAGARRRKLHPAVTPGAAGQPVRNHATTGRCAGHSADSGAIAADVVSAAATRRYQQPIRVLLALRLATVSPQPDLALKAVASCAAELPSQTVHTGQGLPVRLSPTVTDTREFPRHGKGHWFTSSTAHVVGPGHVVLVQQVGQVGPRVGAKLLILASAEQLLPLAGVRVPRQAGSTASVAG